MAEQVPGQAPVDPFADILSRAQGLLPPAPNQAKKDAQSQPAPDDPFAGIINRARQQGLMPQAKPPAAPVPRPRPEIDNVVSRAQDAGLIADPGKQQEASDEGFWPLIGRAFVQSAVQAGTEMGAGAAAAVPQAIGGSTIAQQAAGLPEPNAQDEITRLSKQGVLEGATNPRWWGVMLANNVGGAAPTIGLTAAGGLAGGAVGGPAGAAIGGGAGGAIGMSLQSLVPAYKIARARGLDHDAAIDEALKVSGLSAAFGAVMGMTGMTSLTGTAINGALKRPISEALIKAGVVEPAIGLTQEQAIKSVRGQGGLTPDELLNGYVQWATFGAAMHGATDLGRPLMSSLRHVGSSVAATAEGLRAAYGAVQPPPGVPDPMPPKWPVDPDFYHRVTDAIVAHPKDELEPHEWHDTMKNAHGDAVGVDLPFWLAGKNGKIQRDHLLNYVESRGLDTPIFEVTVGGTHLGYEMHLKDPSGVDFSKVLFQRTSDADGRTVLGILDIEPPIPSQWLKSNAYDLIARRISEYAADNNMDRISWRDVGHAIVVNSRFADAMKTLADLHGMQGGDTKVDRWIDRTPHYEMSPAVMANVRQGATLFSEKPGTYVDRAPFQRGYDALNGYLDRNVGTAFPKSEWIKTPEGGNGMYLRISRQPGGKRLIDVANVDFMRKGTGAFTHYLAHLEREAHARGLHGVRVENIFNDRLPAFLEQRGYTREEDLFGGPPSMRREKDPSLPYEEPGRASEAPHAALMDYTRLARENLPSTERAIERFARGELTPEKMNQWLNLSSQWFRMMEHARPDSEYIKGLVDLTRKMHEAVAAGDHTALRANLEQLKRDFGPEQTRHSAVSGGPFPTARSTIITPVELKAAAEKIVKIIEDLRKTMGMKVPLQIGLHYVPHPRGGMYGYMNKSAMGYHINLYLNAHDRSGAEGLFATAAHEFGHVVMEHFFDRAPMDIKNRVMDAYNEFRRLGPPNPMINDILMKRNNAVTQAYGEQLFNPDVPLLSMTPERQRYWNGFEEWFAEQVARWATTGEKPGFIIDKWFQSLGRRIIKVIGEFRDKLVAMYPPGPTRREAANRLVMQPSKVMKDWLDSFISDTASFAPDIYAAAQLSSIRQAREDLNSAHEPGMPAVAATTSTGNGRGLISRIFGGTGFGGNIAAGADYFNRVFKYATSLPQLAKANPHVEGLQRYTEYTKMMAAEINSMRNEAETTAHLWRALQPAQADRLARLIDDFMNMTYRTPLEIRNKTVRKPTQIEFDDLVRRHGVNDRGLEVFKSVVQDFDRMLDRYQKLLEQEANHMADPVMAAQKMADIQSQIDKMRAGPYFPAMRFGPYTMTIRDSANLVKHFETFETRKALQQAMVAAQNSPQFAGHRIREGYLAKDVAPLVGLPPGLLDKIANAMSLSSTQKEILEELRYEYVPAQSFTHQFRKKQGTPGYSDDFLRAYAYYMFHGANYFGRAKYIDVLQKSINNTRETSKQLDHAVRRDQIANFMADHFQHLMNPKTDFARLRSAAFHWALGFSPAAATLNLSQTVLGTYPYLASKFGSDVKALAAMANSSRKLSTYYTKMSLADTTDPQLKGISEAVRQGLISETQANVLAATADGRVLSQGFGGNRAEKAFNLFSRASQFFFEMTEQTNRRLAFRAAWDMAMADPGNQHVLNMVRENKILHDALRLRGFTEQEARAYVTAKDAVDSTQYVYAPWARPRIFRGKFGSLFVFHSFTQNTLFYLWNNPGALVRSMIILAGAGGLMGIPGSEDIAGIARVLAYHLFGKDFDLQDQIRQYVVDHLHGGGQVERPGSLTTSEGGIRPDILLHGMSRVGYGLPALADYLGETAGMGHIPMPVIDRHQNLGMGNILPIEPAQLLAPQVTGPGAGASNVDAALDRQSQRAAGAIYGFGFALYRALESQPTVGREMSGLSNLIDAKRWESVMPAALRNASQAFRFYQEGRARNAQGASVVRFDPNEPEHMYELLAKAMGYTPARLSAAWDRRTAEREAEAFWDLRRQYLLQSAWSAKQSTDPSVYSAALEAIRKYNGDLPDEARGKAITGDALRKSFEDRAKATAKTEGGIPQAKGNIPLARSVQKLYPEANPAAGQRRYPPQGGALGR